MTSRRFSARRYRRSGVQMHRMTNQSYEKSRVFGVTKARRQTVGTYEAGCLLQSLRLGWAWQPAKSGSRCAS